MATGGLLGPLDDEKDVAVDVSAGRGVKLEKEERIPRATPELGASSPGSSLLLWLGDRFLLRRNMMVQYCNDDEG